MTPANGRARALREAVRIAPDDAGLRLLLAEALLDAADPAAAEDEFRTALRLDPHNRAIKHGLARSFQHQAKWSAALVVLEDLAATSEPPEDAGALHLLHARVLLESGELARARIAYGAAEAAGASDIELAVRLGGTAEPTAAEAASASIADPASPVPLEKPAIGFESVGGMNDLKDEIRAKIIHPLQHPELYRSYGKAAGGGILMYGPPGCGKTHLARAVAGEVRAGFVAVGIHDVLDMWIGQSERNLHELFDEARHSAPCVLFFDEVDALAARRSDLRTSAGRPLINQFLAELDGFAGDENDGVLILAATNAPWHLDPAFRRPGRFDRVIFVPPPDAGARAEILRILCGGKPVGQIDFDKVAKRTEGFSGADLRAAVESAIEAKLPEAIRAGRPVPLETGDLLAAAKRVRPSTRDWFSTARNYVLYANDSGLYDDVRAFL